MTDMQTRSLDIDFKTRAEGEDLYLDGYFALFDTETKLWEGAYESIAKGAFTESLKNNDVRALTNHDHTLVLGRTGNGTLTLEEDDKGLRGTIKINKSDTDAVNLYERVKRGDVTGNSFGFDIISEKEEVREDGNVKWTIEKVKLYEVSVTTFPAYEDTTIEARKKDFKDIESRSIKRKKEQLRRKLDEFKDNNARRKG